ncbi:hypothetical protein A3H53_01935 [Candidatus Nomurabacteria bacterium RIFCSPLOWO2_02_FULL_40_10]|uniref:Uncharacterized protein n=2 Tax=Candidatus Nomuraibacteriota TaxID=1752729 RepID=A0A1F6XZN4_9BACT|nr:MAG: hypothetical protein A2642_03770 [Candidatus Nomurabacteria bacterium RIFCSPHIGHO2_01_FULL_39_10]OGI99575.1 MAG: hypothetical protein A3H53_01935 [Candidatus Nomurabacteria bacterium RIFCSPLOWO2_02_FULL_40_10]
MLNNIWGKKYSLPIRWIKWFLFNRHIPITIINDCRDSNAEGRIVTRLASLLPLSKISFVGVKDDIEAAFCLVDMLDALEGRKGIKIINVAPRHGVAKCWSNGTPFCETKIGHAMIFSTIDGHVLSLIQDILGYKLRVKLYNIPEVVTQMGLSLETQTKIIKSQFRSFDFLPRLVAMRVKGKEFPYTITTVKNCINEMVGFTDVFGNIKTTIIYKEQYTTGTFFKKFKVGDVLLTEIKFYPRLKDVPNGELAVIVGSSGFGNSRFLEIVVQGQSASEKLGYPEVGTPIQIL